MMPPVRSVPPPDAAGIGHGRRSSETAWTGEKRRKTVGEPSPPLDLGSSSSDSDDATEVMLMYDNCRSQVQEDEHVFSAEDIIDCEEIARCYEVLKSRENNISIYTLSRLRLHGESRQNLLDHLARLRYREFKLLKESDCSLDDTTDTLPVSELPDEVWDWENPSEPVVGKFGWTFDWRYYDVAELDDYQRIVLTSPDPDEYPYWKEYCSTYSSYEADEEYVKYWDELFKKIKWIEEYMHLDRKEFLKYRYRGVQQAMKIAASFCHLPASLADLGFNEYIQVLRDDYDFGKDCGGLYLGLWKRVVKRHMNFKEALGDILTLDNTLPSNWLRLIKSEIMGYEEMYPHFLICKEHIQKHIEEHIDDDDDETLLKIINDVLYTKVERPKWYVDYAKKKLEVARRICLLHGMGRAGEEGSKTAPPIMKMGHVI